MNKYVYSSPLKYLTVLTIVSPQRSLVILTHHQYPALFTALASIFGPLFQTHGVPMLEAACHNIASWYVCLYPSSVSTFC